MMMQIPVQVGQRLGGRYRVDAALARGGTSVVFSGTDLEEQKPIAIKVMLPEMAKAASSRSRFEREIRVLRHLRSEHVVKVLDDGALSTGEPFLVMERLLGRTLKEALLANGPFGVADAVDLVLQACEVLAEAHVAGVVHRDVKPENLFLVGEGTKNAQLKLFDFGLSKAQNVSVARDSDEPSITRSNEVMGSPYYMAPEQLLASRHVDRTADVWSIGIVLYELLTGELPFGGETLERIRAHVLLNTPAPMSSTRSEIPAELETIVMRCLEKSPNERFKGLAVLAASLAPFGSDRAKGSVAQILSAAPGKVPPPLPQKVAPALVPSPPPPMSPPEPGFTRVQMDDTGSMSVIREPLASPPAQPSVSWATTANQRAIRARRRAAVGVGVIGFTLGVAIGIVFSVWQASSSKTSSHAAISGANTTTHITANH